MRVGGGAPATTIRVPGLKVTVPLSAASLPRDLVPPEGPAGEPTLDPVLIRLYRPEVLHSRVIDRSPLAFGGLDPVEHASMTTPVG